jgi:hypothetical protein
VGGGGGGGGARQVGEVGVGEGGGEEARKERKESGGEWGGRANTCGVERRPALRGTQGRVCMCTIGKGKREEYRCTRKAE